jgi:predicted HAD superfamily phosphohydrolase YqeG
MCLCGVEATIIDGESTLAALDRHYATPEHRAWKARRAA